MLISAIVAVSENNVIGLAGHLPWRLPADLKYFKSITTGHHIILGRKNYEDIAKPLPNRVNIVLTRDSSYEAPGCVIAHSLEEALQFARDAHESECFIVGGAAVYKEALPHCKKLYLTRVLATVEGDVFMPSIGDGWVLQSETKIEADEKNIYSMSFEIWERP